MTLRDWLCRIGWHGGGYVVSGYRGHVLMVGWRCAICGAVKYYAPASLQPGGKE